LAHAILGWRRLWSSSARDPHSPSRASLLAHARAGDFAEARRLAAFPRDMAGGRSRAHLWAAAAAVTLCGGPPAVWASQPEQPHGHGYKSSSRWLPREPVVTMPTAEEMLAGRELPRDFDWRAVNGENFVTADLNQHQPRYCGSCWVHATVSALSDRIKIMRRRKFPDVILGRQSIMNCVPDPAGEGPPPGCNGGDPWMIHTFMHHTKVPDESCLAYAAVNQGCSAFNVCRNCNRGIPTPEDPYKPGDCFGMSTFIGYGVSDYGHISGEAAMMKEIYARGPIACAAVTTFDFMANYTQNFGVKRDGVYIDHKNYTEADVDHIIELAGWGETDLGTKYWVIRNSWGTYWGDAGWFKLERGVNSVLVESSCDWAVPDFAELDRDMLHRVQGDYFHGPPTGSANFGPGKKGGTPVKPPSVALGELLAGGSTVASRETPAVGAAGTAVASGALGALLAWAVPRLVARARRGSVRQPAGLLG